MQHTDIALQLVLSKLKPRQLRELLLEQLTGKPLALEPLAATATPIAPTAAARADRYVFLNEDGDEVAPGSEHVAVIQDSTTGLQWGAKALAKGKQYTHAEATKAAEQCDLLGAGDWQLPTIQQMRTVEDLTRHAPAVQAPFAAHWPKEGWAWTRSQAAGPDYSDYAWVVNLNHGLSSINNRSTRGVALVCRVVPGAVPSPRQS